MSCPFYRGKYKDVCCNSQPDAYKTEAPGLIPGPIPAPMQAPFAPALITSPSFDLALIIPPPLVLSSIAAPPITSTPTLPPLVTPVPVMPSSVISAPIIPPPDTPAPVMLSPVAPAPSSVIPVTFLAGGNPAPVIPVHPVHIRKGCHVCLNGGLLRNPTVVIDALGGFTRQCFYNKAEYVPEDGQ